MTEQDRELLQRVVDSLFREKRQITRLDAVLRAEAFDLPEDLRSIVELLPPGNFSRQRLCDQLNSAIVGHGWSRRFGTVD